MKNWRSGSRTSSCGASSWRSIPGRSTTRPPSSARGSGLDSIDALELVLGLEQEFQIKVEDEEVGVKAFASVNALCDFIEQKKTA